MEVYALEVECLDALHVTADVTKVQCLDALRISQTSASQEIAAWYCQSHRGQVLTTTETRSTFSTQITFSGRIGALHSYQHQGMLVRTRANTSDMERISL